ncbi:MAG: PLP-dependent aminotransferase family protein [Rhodospirillales bacterium]|nr:PLP-dependent aminotransferase family protein [Rhodospirillales bacterium]
MPDLTAYQGPIYLSIANALAADLADGRLTPGDQMPTHRDLAYRLGITVGTVSRAYSEAKRRGLIASEVGRGTYVQGDQSGYPHLTVEEGLGPEMFDFSLNLPAKGEAEQALATVLGDLSRSGGLSTMLDYQPEAGMRRHRIAGAKWLSFIGIETDPEHVIVTNGAQNGIAVALSTVTRPGDIVLTESVTYTGIKDFAAHRDLRLSAVAMDEQGIRPDALEEACTTHRPKALYCMPTLQNPTARIMSEPRRQEIVAIARTYGVTIVEDAAYDWLMKDPPPPLAVIAPDITVLLSSISKTIAPGMRLGYVYAPNEFAGPIGATMRSDCRMATPLMAEIVTRWIEDGSAERMNEWQRGEVAIRQSIVREELAGIDYETHPESYHLWLPLPAPWRAEEFVAQVRTRNVVLMPAEAFVVGRDQSPHVVRISIGSAKNHERLRAGLAIIAETLKTPQRPAQSVI